MKTYSKLIFPKTVGFFCALVTFFFIALVTNSNAQSGTKYNVIFISLDDMNDKCSILDFPAVLTPNLQRLAAHGMTFKNCYASYALCNPSRTSILSGYRPDKTQVLGNDDDPRAKIGWAVRLLPEYFHDYGYHTERYAKIMHNSYENECQWDYYFDWNDTDDDNFLSANEKGADINPGGPASWYINQGLEAATVNASVAWKVDSSLRTQTSPFFMGVGLAVHNPFTPTLDHWNEYGDSTVQELLRIDGKGHTSNIRGNGSKNIALPQTPVNDARDIPAIAFTRNMVIQSDSEWQRAVHAYYSEVTEMDKQLGVIINTMDELNLWSNTVVVFWSDHGQHLGEHGGLWLKGTLFNESLHVPFIICAPSLPSYTCSRLVENIDMYPTLLDLCKLPMRTDLEGSSLKPLLYHRDFAWKKATFQQVQRTSADSTFMARSVFTEQYHYNSWGAEGEELYDKINDPFEYTNLFYNPAYAAILDSMRNILARGWTSALPPQYTFRYYYRDADGDGYGNPNDSAGEYVQPAGFVENNEDCDDNKTAVHAGAEEKQDGIDNNCNGEIDEGFTTRTYYRDTDKDGYGNISHTVIALIAPLGYVHDSSDCNDSNAAIHPGTAEVCDGIDNDCNGLIDDGITKVYYRDADGDGYGVPGDSIITCDPPAGYALNNKDCNDKNAAAHPDAPDFCDGVDNNCNGVVDEYKLNATITPAGIVKACSGVPVTLYANSVAGTVYQWYNNGSKVFTSVPKTLKTLKSGSFQVQESNGFNCSSLSAATIITRIDTPSANITVTGNLDICLTGFVVLNAAKGLHYTYQWQRNNVNIPYATLRTYTATTAGNYRVIVTKDSVCTNISHDVKVTKSCHSIAAQEFPADAITVAADDVSVFPNPTGGKFFINYTSHFTGAIRLYIYNTAGQIVYSKTENALLGFNQYPIIFPAIGNGIFFLELKNEKQSFRIKLVVEK